MMYARVMWRLIHRCIDASMYCKLLCCIISGFRIIVTLEIIWLSHISSESFGLMLRNAIVWFGHLQKRISRQTKNIWNSFSDVGNLGLNELYLTKLLRYAVFNLAIGLGVAIWYRLLLLMSKLITTICKINCVLFASIFRRWKGFKVLRWKFKQ